MGIKLLLGSDYHGSPRLIRQALAHLPEVDAYINCGVFCSKAGKPSRKATQGFHPQPKQRWFICNPFWRQWRAWANPGSFYLATTIQQLRF